ncbi:hypothetical protein HYPDE_28423 [Hyphomicrobium denitrificans 1NES1]|uniref:Uncharacterized protein n=1 Tax=Hyphomicrobium denitrificans 1NES1 TaxID=670307 RepID=N0B1K2_9HYPH|nr:hypothetical protein HYPDE_28423 [Hyphomicrobium denitrificans 1NES1]
MPFSSLNRILMDRQITLNGAWQRWTGLPEGASLWFRLGAFTAPSNPYRYFDVDYPTLARRSASPCAERMRAFRPTTKSPPSRRGCGHLEDGVPHAEALSPASRFSPTPREDCSARIVEEAALVVSALATTPETPSM